MSITVSESSERSSTGAGERCSEETRETARIKCQGGKTAAER